MCLSPLNNCGPLQDYRAIISRVTILHWYRHTCYQVLQVNKFIPIHKKHIKFNLILLREQDCTLFFPWICLKQNVHTCTQANGVELATLTTEKAISSAQHPNKPGEFSWLCLNIKLALEHSHVGGTQRNHCAALQIGIHQELHNMEAPWKAEERNRNRQ